MANPALTLPEMVLELRRLTQELRKVTQETIATLEDCRARHHLHRHQRTELLSLGDAMNREIRQKLGSH